MSRIGKQLLQLPENITISFIDKDVLVKGPKGEIIITGRNDIDVEINENFLKVTRKNETKATRAAHGTMRNLIRNAVVGVTEGYKKTLELVGIGYRVKLEGSDLNLSLGYSHPVIFKAINGISFSVDGQNKIIISGMIS